LKEAIQSVITVEKVVEAIRQRYSPFPELSMEIIAQQLNCFRVGDLRPAARTWEVMMERDGELYANASKRFSDLSRLSYEIMADEESAEADRQKEAFIYFFDHLRATSVLEQDETGGFQLLLRQMMTAKAYRYSVHEILTRVDNPSKKEVTAEFRHCPVWFFEARRGKLGFLRNDFALYGEPLLPGEWLPAIGDGLMRQCAIAYLIKHYPLRDSLLYCARFGLPGVHGKTDAAKDSPEWNDFEAALKAFMNDWILMSNKGAEIALIEASKGGSGTLPFDSLIERTDKLYAKLFRGSDLATSAAKDVTGADMQKGEKNIFVEDDAAWASDIIYERIIRPFSHYLFNQEPLVYLKLLTPKPDTSDRDIKSAEFLTKHGVPIAISTARERLGWPKPEDDEEILQAPQANEPAPSSLPNDPALENSANENQFFAALAADLKPLRDRLERVLQIEDPKLFEEKLRLLLTEIEQLKRDIAADPSSARALEALLAENFKRGVAAKTP
jgi:phage gp29-like protein